MSYSFQVLVNDKPITTYAHDGDTYVEGRPNSIYKLRITNGTWQEVEAVVSVDGLSVLTGKPASEYDRGYLVPAYGSITIDGWRVSDTTVREFRFGQKSKSYSNKTGQGMVNVGVIGLMVFPKAYDTYIGDPYAPITWYSINEPTPMQWSIGTPAPDLATSSISTSTATLSGGTINYTGSVMRGAAIQPQNNIGTEMGAPKRSDVSLRHFKRAPGTAPTIYAVYYDDRRGLEARGIVVDRRKMHPNPFPASTKYCKEV